MYFIELERRHRRPTGFGSPRRPGCCGCTVWLVLTSLLLTVALRACA